jgi:ArsR family transcriptional regulator, virulence genes transcriptional regulator
LKRNHDLFKLKASLCKAFADPNRLIIIDELRHGEKTVGELTQAMNIAQAVTSRHLAILRERGVVTFRRENNNVFYRLSNPRICEACDIVHQVLLEQLEKNKQIAETLVT